MRNFIVTLIAIALPFESSRAAGAAASDESVRAQMKLYHEFATTEFPKQIDILDASKDCATAMLSIKGADAFVTRAAGTVNGMNDARTAAYRKPADALSRTLASATLRAPSGQRCPDQTIKALRERAKALARETDPKLFKSEQTADLRESASPRAANRQTSY